MTKRYVDFTDYAGEIIRAMKKGILLTTKAGNKTNSMVIGWGTLGTNWVKPTFVTYVRESRFSRQLLAENPEFTINVPLGEVSAEALKICGSKSGRDMDKLSAAGLTAVEPDVISVPGIKEFPLTLECRVTYVQAQEPEQLEPDLMERHYPADENGARDRHVSFYGEIVSAYIIEE